MGGMELSAGLPAWMQGAQAAAAQGELAACNRATEACGLALTQEQMTGLVERRREALQATGRVEFGRGVLYDIVLAFRDSPYVQQAAYDDVLAEVQDVFYRRKEDAEADGGMADDELIAALRAVFDDVAHGSTDTLDAVPLSALRARAEGQRAGSYHETTQREADEEQSEHEEDDERVRDELDRVRESDRLERPGNEYAAGFYDGYNELYRIGFDGNSRIGGSSFS